MADSAPSTLATMTTATSSALSSTITGSASSTSSQDIPLELWSIANSLISSAYPSSSITNVQALSWPSAVAIGTSTHTFAPTSTATSAPSSTQTAGKSASNHTGLTDRSLGIAISVAFGVIALAVLALVLLCLRRRRRRNGGSGLFRRESSVSNSDMEQWRDPMIPAMGAVAAAQNPMTQRHSRERVERYNRIPDQRTPPADMHPAFGPYERFESNEENPFFTPEERSEHPYAPREAASKLADGDVDTAYHPGYIIPAEAIYPHDTHHASAEVSSQRASGPYTSSSHTSAPELSSHRSSGPSRPVTPFNPLLMHISAKQREDPFVSPEDERHDDAEDEKRDFVSPILSPRTPERRHSPMVHYPSWSEISEFDFSGQREGVARQSGDGYRKERESVVGRTELA